MNAATDERPSDRHPVEVQDRSDRAEPIAPRRRWVTLIMLATFTLVAVALLRTVDTARWPSAELGFDNPLILADRWIESLNGGEVTDAVSLLSPDAVCDLPTPAGGVETCGQHLGYLAAIGSKFDEVSCRDSAPYRCTYHLSSDLVATLGYPDHNLRMTAVYALDEDGLLVVDLSQGSDITDAYFPGDAGSFWEWLAGENPGLGVDSRRGPDIYDAEMGTALMAAVRAYTDPGRISRVTQSLFDDYTTEGLLQCATPDGQRPCSELMGFLEGIEGRVDLRCDALAAQDFSIPCVATVDSAVHRALGSAPSTSELVIHYRGGQARGFEMNLRFATDDTTHQAFFEYAASRSGLFGSRPIWSASTAPDWVSAATDFADGT